MNWRQPYSPPRGSWWGPELGTSSLLPYVYKTTQYASPAPPPHRGGWVGSSPPRGSWGAELWECGLGIFN